MHLWSGCAAGTTGRRRRHRAEPTKGEEGVVTPDLVLKHRDATLAVYV